MKIVENANGNPDNPKHHNIYYRDTHSSNGEIYTGNEWTTKKIDEILDTLVDTRIGDLNNLLDEMGDLLSKKARKKIIEAISNADYPRHNSPNPDSRDNLKKHLKLILYNNRHNVKKTIDQIKDITDNRKTAQ